MKNTIDHIGILVPNLEAGIAQWAAITGFTFSPIARYQTPTYRDHSSPHPHPHDARISLSREGAPYIELMEFHGDGTHSAAQGAGIHHLAFMDRTDIDEQIVRLTGLGVAIDGEVRNEGGEVILCFTDPSKLNGIRIEYVAQGRHPVVRDDGLPLDIDAAGNPSLWPVASP